MHNHTKLLALFSLLVFGLLAGTASAVQTTTALFPVREGESSSNPFEECRRGDIMGFGYNPVTKRFKTTCGNYNWGHVQDLEDASYYVDCTGYQAPHASCLRSGERRLINALYRAGLAPYYTEDGGTVLFPLEKNKNHAFYVDIGCGPSEDGTENDCPRPYDPERESMTDANGHYVFSKVGYNHKVQTIRSGQRGVKFVAEGKPGVQNEAEDDPILTGVWFVNDRGNDAADGPAAAAREGTENYYTPNWIFGSGYANNNGPQRCVDSADGSMACDLTPSFKGVQEWENYMTASVMEYGVTGTLTTTIDASTATQHAIGCFQNGTGQCSANAAEPCDSDSDCSSGTCTISQTTTSATCRYDRKTACWNKTAGANRTAGGCVSDDGEVDLGPCEGFVDALIYDTDTRGSHMGMLAQYGGCDLEPSDAYAASSCLNAGTLNQPVGIRSFDQTLGTVCTGAMADAAKEIVFGTSGLHPNNTEGDGSSRIFFQRYVPAGRVAGATALGDKWYPFNWSKYYIDGGGSENFGYMPSDWYGKSTCLSGDDSDSADDEPACDTGALLNVMPGAKHGHKNFLVLNASGINKSNLDGATGAYYPYFKDGKVMYSRRNTLTDPSWGWTYDNVHWIRNTFGSAGIALYGPFVEMIDNVWIGNKGSGPIMLSGTYAGSSYARFKNNKFFDNYSSGSSAFWFVGGQGISFDDTTWLGDIGGGLFWFYPGGAAQGARKSVKNISIRNTHWTGDGDTDAGLFLFSCSGDATATNEYVQNVLIDGVRALPHTNTHTPIIRVTDADASNCQVLENMGTITLQNANNNSRYGGCLYSVNGNCSTGTTIWGPTTTGVTPVVGASTNLPRMVGNTAMNVPAPDWPWTTMLAAQAPTCAQLNPGAVIAIRDDTVAAGTCTDTVAGTLTGGGTYVSVCKCSAAGAWEPL